MYDVLPQHPGPSLTTHGTVAPASSCNGSAGIRGDSTYVHPYQLTLLDRHIKILLYITYVQTFYTTGLAGKKLTRNILHKVQGSYQCKKTSRTFVVRSSYQC